MKAFVQRSVFVLLALLAARGDGLRGQWKIVASSALPPATIYSGLGYESDGCAMCFVSGVLWAGTSSLWSSTDMGKTWFQSTNAPSCNYYDISFFDSLDGAVATGNGVYITNDGGQNWKPALDSACVKVSFIGSTNVLGALCDYLGFFLSRDGGVTWQKTYPLSQISAFCFTVAPDGTVYFISGDWNTEIGSVKVSTDNGQTWTDQQTPVDVDAWTLSVDSCDSKLLYLADDQYGTWETGFGDSVSKLLRSTDGGVSWETVQSFSAPFFSGSLSNSSQAIFAATGALPGGVYRSTDQGISWKNLGGPAIPEESRNIVAVNNNTVFALDYIGSVWATFNSGGDSVLAVPGGGPFTVTPLSLFSYDTVYCDTLIRFLSVSSLECSPASINSSRIIGPDSTAFFMSAQVGNSIPVAFHGIHYGDHHAELILQISNGTFDTIALGGYSSGEQPLNFSTSDANTDTLGALVSIPITIAGLTQPENINLTLHYDTSLQYQGFFDAANVKLDIPGQQWAGRSKLNIASAQSGVVAGYARFTVFADSGAKPQVTFDSLDVLSASSSCEYSLPSAATSTITPPSGCGTIILSQVLQSGQIPTFTVRPNPTMGDVELTSSLDLGNAEVEIYDMLGIKRGDVLLSFVQDSPINISMPENAGIYYLRVKSASWIGNLSVVVAK